MSATYINPKLPATIRGLQRADMTERSIQNVLDLAADLVQELIDIKSAPADPGPESVATVRAEVISDAIAYLKSTPAVLLAGKGGAYELLEKWVTE